MTQVWIRIHLGPAPVWDPDPDLDPDPDPLEKPWI